MVEESVCLFFFNNAANFIHVSFPPGGRVWGIQGLGLDLQSIPCECWQ